MTFHNIPPVFNADSRYLILGSFPSVRSREAEFFYAHPQNRFWRVLAFVFGTDVPVTTDEKKKLLLENGAALWDTIASCDIEGSSDTSIKNVVPNDISIILVTAKIEKIFCNGGKSYETYMKYIYPTVGIRPVKLPSTSPANAARSFETIAEIWRNEILGGK